MDSPNLEITRNSRSRGQLMIFAGLLWISTPVIQRYVFHTEYQIINLIFGFIAVLFFLLGFWRISQNISYSFTVKNNVVRQSHTGHPASNFSINLREIEAIKAKPGKEGAYFLVLSNGKRYLIPNTMGNHPKKIARHLEKHII